MLSRSTTAIVAALVILTALVGCSPAVPDRRTDAAALAAQVRDLPGVLAATPEVVRSPAQGMVFFRLYVDVAEDLTADQAAAITGRYLRDIGGGKYAGYRLELDMRRGWNLFAVDSGRLPITNQSQIVAQSRDWTALRREFPSATVTLRSTVAHPGGQFTMQEGGHSNLATLELTGSADYTDVSAAEQVLSQRYPHLGTLDWTVDAGKDHPAEISTSRRLATPAELAVFDRLNADQSIPHIDRLTINGPDTGPVWFAEKTTGSHDVAVAVRLARAHLPLVAALPGPVLYSAGDQLSGHIGGLGFARGPVVVTVGGCTKHDPLVYEPIPDERQLIAKYEKCVS